MGHVPRVCAQALRRAKLTQCLYKHGETPEEQWVQHFARSKLASMRAQPPVDTDVVIDVDLEMEAGAPRLWRRVRLSSATPMSALEDKARPDARFQGG